jgi:hypothetical protein
MRITALEVAKPRPRQRHRRPTGSLNGNWRCCGCWPRGGPTRRSAPSCTSAQPRPRVHISNILRKRGVTSRVQAAALAERAGLLPSGQP